MLDTESDFGLRWLFNPNSFEFLPIEEQLKKYKSRDLAKAKTYATATKLWGLSRNRKRVFIAPPMGDHPGRDVSVRLANARLKPLDTPSPPAKNKDWALSELEKIAAHDQEIEEKSSEYKAWLEDRMKLRDGLENLGLNEEWLRHKPDPSPLERRVVERMRGERLGKHAINKEGHDPTSIKLEVPSSEPVMPGIKRPPPEAMAVIAKYLTAKRQRLIDLFARADKDKSWTLTRGEFQRCIKEAGIPISSQLLSDLLESLDQDSNDVIDYREFVHGMKDFRIDERKKVSMALNKDKQPDRVADLKSALSATSPLSDLRRSGSQRSVSAVSGASSSHSPTDATSRSSSPFLLPPVTDLTERRELEPDEMIEKRKRERHLGSLIHRKKKGKSKGVGKVRSGNPAIDSHSMRSTIGGETGSGINQYREARLKEYHDICKLCEKHGIDLTPQLLERALLHPGDKPISRISSRIRQPGTHTLSQHFADPPVPSEPPPKYHDPDKVVVSRSGELMMEAKHAYPQAHEVRAEAEMVSLSSGKAFVSRKVDCWMTFEEYDRLTGHLAKRYVTVDGAGVDPNVFWPGHLLDKLHLCMPGTDRPDTDSIFTSTRSTTQRAYPGYNNDLRWWPVSEHGYMMPADYEQNKVYSIDPK
ncbi:EF-hand calcium-binding domain-containing protein 12-like isoform X2 [Acanthaster planci]|uniref:EF-hand calcium-binding domain-containing protein 12-like isoform X2 n=1 Tax=Acanthaster planci TaxID=133434 RepID=A0A8B7Z8U0_ACAPL|nr:EF-hand calcium-binding domain-containing protein 12-like isoform X2 [Acanthaster planci]